jgi:hypothetical protein
MKRVILGFLAATAAVTVASAAPLNTAATGGEQASNIDPVRVVCNEYGRCWRTRGPRYITRDYDDDGYYRRRSYGYYGDRGYYDGPAYRGYSGGGPSIGFSFGTGRW